MKMSFGSAVVPAVVMLGIAMCALSAERPGGGVRNPASKPTTHVGQRVMDGSAKPVKAAAPAAPKVAAATDGIVVHSNLGPGDTYSFGGGFGINDVVYRVACPFVPPTTCVVDAIELPLGLVSGQDAVIVSLFDDEQGLPDAELAWDQVGEMDSYDPLTGNPVSLVTFVPNGSRLTLEASKRYWVVVQQREAGIDVRWFQNITGDVGGSAFDWDDGTGWHKSPGLCGAFRVTAEDSCAVARAARTAQERAKGMIESVLPKGMIGLLAELRQFRDRALCRTDDGRQLTALYYQHTEELKMLLASDPGLAVDTVQVVLKLLPSFRAAGAERSPSIRVEAGTFAAGEQLLDRYEAAGSPDLQQAVQRVRAYIDARCVRRSAVGVELKL